MVKSSNFFVAVFFSFIRPTSYFVWVSEELSIGEWRIVDFTSYNEIENCLPDMSMNAA